MKRHSGWLFRILLVATVGLAVDASAQWVEGGACVISEPLPQSQETAVADGAGGVYVVWVDQRQYPWQMLTAQRIDEGGEVVWVSDGIQVCAVDTLQLEPAACLGADGSLYVAWRSLDGYAIRAMAQRILPDGTLAWGLDGVELGISPGTLNDVKVCPGYEDGAVFAWLENTGVQTQVRVNSLNAAGSSVWGGGGYQITTSPVDKSELCLASDGLGGAYLAWVDLNNDDVYADWILFEGTVRWGGGAGVVVCDAVNAQSNISMIADGAGGVIVSWTDTRTDPLGDIYAQKIEPTHGTPVWSAGAPVCTVTGVQGISKLAPGGNGGAYVVWLDARDQAYDLYVQKLNGSGNPEWEGNGLSLCDVDGFKYGPVVVPDGSGGMIAAWQDGRSGSTTDVFAQRVDAAMNFLWDEGGLAVCTEPLDQTVSSVIPDGLGGATFVWGDDRYLFDTDVYAQRIDRFGKWGFPVPYIVSVTDVPGDQGGEVLISWWASRLDVDPLSEIFYYSIWRAVDLQTARDMLDEGAVRFSDDDPSKSDSGDPVLRLGMLAGEPYYWTQVGQVESSYYTDSYAATAPTLFDSTTTSPEPHYFQIMAHGYVTPEHWISDVRSVWSVDNLAPATPSDLSGERIYDPAGLTLSWRPNVEPDLARYEVYGGTSADFIPDPSTFVASTADTTLMDESWSGGGRWYKVAAVDMHGNASPFAVLAPEMVTGVGETATPRAAFVGPNFPNPFNPSTTIRYGLHEPARVTLRIYDAAGGLVRSLVDEAGRAGVHTVEWNGRNAAGRDVASGVYFYRLRAGEFERTRKMILVR